ncbi:MAG: hypothetical protein JJE04_14615 [Acidobacteriia bacterium]|nr:hypothetical protein [Terriglobia bacterium]
MRRLFLKVLAGAITPALRLAAQAAAPASAKSLTTEDLKKLVDSKSKFFFLDVREPKELEELGTMKGFVNIPLSQVEARLSEIPRNIPVVLA